MYQLCFPHILWDTCQIITHVFIKNLKGDFWVITLYFIRFLMLLKYHQVGGYSHTSHNISWMMHPCLHGFYYLTINNLLRLTYLIPSPFSLCVLASDRGSKVIRIPYKGLLNDPPPPPTPTPQVHTIEKIFCPLKNSLLGELSVIVHQKRPWYHYLTDIWKW